MRLSKPTDCTTARVNLKVSYGLWAIMCQPRFTLVNNAPSDKDIDKARGCANMGSGGK